MNFVSIIFYLLLFILITPLSKWYPRCTDASKRGTFMKHLRMPVTVASFVILAGLVGKSILAQVGATPENTPPPAVTMNCPISTTPEAATSNCITVVIPQNSVGVGLAVTVLEGVGEIVILGLGLGGIGRVGTGVDAGGMAGGGTAGPATPGAPTTIVPDMLSWP